VAWEDFEAQVPPNWRRVFPVTIDDKELLGGGVLDEIRERRRF